MIRTISGKILAIVILVLVISFVITGVIMNAWLNRMVSDEKADQLELTASRVISALDGFLKSSVNTNPSLFVNYIQTLASNTDSIIWIIRGDGTIILFSEIPDFLVDKLERSDEGWPRLPDERQYEGQEEGKYQSGDFYGLFKDTGIDWLTVSRSFRINRLPTYSTYVEGIVQIHSEVPSIYSIKSSILLIFIASGVIGTIFALVLVTILTRRTIKPLNQMKLAARRVASGEFSGRIQIKGKDEIAELCDSFNQMVLALENLERMRRDFIGNVSHELRTPITTIKGFVEGILDGVIPPEKQGMYLGIVKDEVKRMQNMVNDLLDLAKLQGDQTTLKLSDFDINELIRRCVISLQQMLIDKNLEFKADFETERMFVRADRDAIQRVLINLLHNAIKFTPENGKISVKTYAEKDKAIISVEDTGSGIPQNELPYIFERFYKTDKSRSADRSGLGLGLAIVRNIIISHNETIKVESEEGRGSRFIFTLRSISNLESY